MGALRMIHDEDVPRYDGQAVPRQTRFAMIPQAVRSLRDPYAKAVYMTLAFYADSDGKCFPSRQTIADETGCSMRKVDNVLATLEDAGLIVIETSDKAIKRARMIHLVRNPPVRNNPETTHLHEVHITEEIPEESHMQEVQVEEPDVHQVRADVQEVRVDVHHVPNDVQEVHPNKTQEQDPTNKTQEQERSTALAPADGFDAFWLAYPKHAEKKQAVDQWRRLKPSLELQATILAAIAAQKSSRKWREGYIKAPHRWLRDQNWQDEVEPVTTSGKGPLGLASW